MLEWHGVPVLPLLCEAHRAVPAIATRSVLYESCSYVCVCVYIPVMHVSLLYNQSVLCIHVCTALCDVCDVCLRALFSILSLLDLTAAFDTTDHSIFFRPTAYNFWNLVQPFSGCVDTSLTDFRLLL